ncbi:sex-determining region Y protein-like [Musca vetustissima]|uniref:sex-determining region Y protein-like n=1 Tax=Musca vetustissima TaxID=27455 RepID=UPI002AB69937|nr:sex-determining region Y protein-like [Musca vetustissima]
MFSIRMAKYSTKINCRNNSFTEFNMVACRITDARNIAANNHHHHPQQQQQQQLSQHPQQQHHHLQQQQMHNRNTGSISASQVPLKNNTDHYRDYETVFIVPGPSCHNQNRKMQLIYEKLYQQIMMCCS